MGYLIDHPQVFDSLPDQFELVILPEDDPEMRLYNLDLLDKQVTEGKPIVFARLQSRRDNGKTRIFPSFFVPVAA